MPHNGKLTQFGPWIPSGSTSGAYPFLNIGLDSPEWIPAGGSDRIEPDKHDADGWLVTDYGGTPGRRKAFNFPPVEDRPGRWRVKWSTNTGAGAGIGVGHSVGTRVGSNTGPSGSFYLTFAAGVKQVLISVAGNDGTNYINNLSMVHEDDEALFDAGGVFGTKFKEIVSNFGVFRPGDWQHMNASNVVTWDHRTRVTAHTYTGSRYDTSRYISSTTNVGDDYSGTLVGATPSGLADKTLVHVKFTTACAGSAPTFNLNGTGAVPIAGANINFFSASYRPVAGGVGTMVYDIVLNQWILAGANSAGDLGIYGGWPPEIIARLCLECGFHPWLILPHYACAPVSDYTTNCATFWKNYAASNATWMIPRFEVANEVWNNGAAFQPTRFFANREVVLYGATNAVHEAYGRAVSATGQVISGVYGGVGSGYQMIIGVQLFGSTSSSAQRFDSSHAIAEGDASDKAVLWATHLAPAAYVEPGYYGTATETTMATEWGTATPTRKIEIEDEYIVYESTAAGQAQAFDGVKVRFDLWCAEAVTRGLAVTQYEGSLEVNIAGAGGDVGGMRNAAKYSTKTYDLARTHYTYYFGKGIEYPAAYGIFGESPWSLFNPNCYETIHYEYDGIISFNASAAPVALTPPTISGSTTQGSVLTGVAGTYSGDTAVLTHQWRRDGANISGQTGTTYLTQLADVGHAIDWYELATNDDGTANQNSNDITVIAASGTTGGGNMYRPPPEPKPKKRRTIRYIGKADERLTFEVADTKANKWIPKTVRSKSVMDKIERDGLIIRQAKSAQLRARIMADDDWFMLN